MIPVK